MKGCYRNKYLVTLHYTINYIKNRHKTDLIDIFILLLLQSQLNEDLLQFLVAIVNYKLLKAVYLQHTIQTALRTDTQGR